MVTASPVGRALLNSFLSATHHQSPLSLPFHKRSLNLLGSCAPSGTFSGTSQSPPLSYTEKLSSIPVSTSYLVPFTWPLTLSSRTWQAITVRELILCSANHRFSTVRILGRQWWVTSGKIKNYTTAYSIKTSLQIKKNNNKNKKNRNKLGQRLWWKTPLLGNSWGKVGHRPVLAI